MPARAELPEPAFVDVGGVEVATYVLEPRAPTTLRDVVFCHGTPWTSRVWSQVASAVAAGRRVLLWDMPGYGRSSMGPDVATDLPSQMATLATLLGHWGSTRPHVVAHDIGGAIALGSHLMHDGNFGSLFLWDAVILEPWGSPFFRLVAEHGGVFAALPPNLHRALVTEYIAGAGNHRLTTDMVAALTEWWTGSTGQAAFYHQIAHLSSDHTRPVEQALHRVRCATRIGWGADDPWIPVEQAHRLQRLLPGTPEVITLDGVGHLAPVEDPHSVTDVVNVWLDECETGTVEPDITNRW